MKSRLFHWVCKINLNFEPEREKIFLNYYQQTLPTLAAIMGCLVGIINCAIYYDVLRGDSMSLKVSAISLDVLNDVIIFVVICCGILGLIGVLSRFKVLRVVRMECITIVMLGLIYIILLLCIPQRVQVLIKGEQVSYKSKLVDTRLELSLMLTTALHCSVCLLLPIRIRGMLILNLLYFASCAVGKGRFGAEKILVGTGVLSVLVMYACWRQEKNVRMMLTTLQNSKKHAGEKREEVKQLEIMLRGSLRHYMQR